jgi:hypothetical protein
VGRAAEAAAIRRMLDGAPLVIATGLPGVGKTAVSLAAARTAAALIGGEDNRYLLLETIREFGATASSGIVIPGPGAGADTGMKRFRGERPWGKRHDAEETADARDTIA